MKKYKQMISFSAALSLIFGLTGGAYANNEMFVEIIPETGGVNITVDTDRDIRKISPYIYGINDIGDIGSISPTVIKQSGVSLSSYNWETNYSNSGVLGMNTNDISLVDDYPSSKWNTPALYADKLAAKSRMYNIPVKLITLPMMGYVAADSMGIVSDDDFSKSTRWHKVKFNKNDTYLNNPDTDDDTVYVDEYVSFLVNRFGSSAEGGINGYFLDSEPDKWSENFPVLHEPPLTFAELVDRSAELANAVKAIDSNAFVFGPSLSGLKGCIDMGNSSGLAISDPQNEYSWFIDYYLSEMRTRSAEKGYRLLDVLDVHYYTEAQTPLGGDVLTGTDPVSNAFRMQAVRTLWDSDYTETSPNVMMYKQFTPIIPTLQASIRMNYPKTRLSFSEYDFGGGNDISGAIAEIDALGIFASQEVYLACLSPQSEQYPFQKAALNLFTDYDGKGSSFGSYLVYSDNANDNMSSVYAALDDSDPELLRIILTNKQMVNEKDFEIEIRSDEYIYELESAAAIDKDTAKLYQPDMELFDCEDNRISFTAETTGAYMLILRGTVPEDVTDETDSVWSTDPQQTEPDVTDITAGSETGVTSDAAAPDISVTESSEYIYIEPSDETVPDLIESETVTQTTLEEKPSETEITTEENVSEIISSETTEKTDDNEDAPKVPLPLKIIVSLMCLTVVGGMVYILFFDKK
ncbi:MAG: glycoside hydrolase family 44 protein [Oscillospiraceae bacterium]|nr:glycoside hydrolase family 44 protein [Oscillospiraceae bacterium]MDY6207277.1 glycoside hydrolase family 44 protein [Oscillospiraceae bacterium]